MADSKLIIARGKTYRNVVRWETEPIVYKPITGISQTAPVRLDVAAHGLVDGWRAAVTNVKGMTEINAEANNVKDRDYHAATVVDSEHIEFNDIDAAGFKAYVSGGYIQYNTPADLTGYTARMSIKDRIGGTLLLSLTTENGRIMIDAVKKTITLVLSAIDTAAITWKRGVFDLEMVSSAGEVTLIAEGSVEMTGEVTT